ncbi:MAG TPA: Xaa-Pro peptidase family protein [Gemmataceae bacterium]|nr:Xaa-Pro peptidase family protein [Gemmataceae bacterium]
MDYPARRRQSIVAGLGGQGPDALLVRSEVNVTYLTGFSGDGSSLLLTPDRAVLVSDSRFTEQIAEECPGLDAAIRPPTKPLLGFLTEAIQALGVRSIGFESDHVTVTEFEAWRHALPALEWKPDCNRVESLRAVKDASEIAAIREAISIAERAYTVFRALLRPDDCEKDLHDALDGYIRRAGGRCSSFPPIVAVGARAALPHAPPSARRIADSDLVLVDWGARGRFYKSDLTRVLATRTISPKLEEVYGVVLRAQAAAIRAVRPGAVAKDVDAEARAVIAQAGFGDFFGHGVGHGLGLEVHEAPSLRPTSEAVLQPGNVVTIEPGIYLPGWGGVRIEDDMLVTPDGCEVLTTVPKDLASIAVFDQW